MLPTPRSRVVPPAIHGRIAVRLQTSRTRQVTSGHAASQVPANRQRHRSTFVAAGTPPGKHRAGRHDVTHRRSVLIALGALAARRDGTCGLGSRHTPRRQRMRGEDDFLVWPHGHPAIPLVGFANLATPHVEIYSGSGAGHSGSGLLSWAAGGKTAEPSPSTNPTCISISTVPKTLKALATMRQIAARLRSPVPSPRALDRVSLSPVASTATGCAWCSRRAARSADRRHSGRREAPPPREAVPIVATPAP